MFDPPQDEEAAQRYWRAHDDDLDALATRMVGLAEQAAQELADAQGVALRVRDQYGRGYTQAYRVGRITVDAYEGVVTRAQRG